MPRSLLARHLCTLFLLLLTWTILFLINSQSRSRSRYLSLEIPDLSVANASLGFQSIIAISAEDPTDPLAWRQRGLIAAANRTKLELTIVQSEEPPATEVVKVMNPSHGKYRTRGEALAWIAHSRVLQRLVREKWTSVLILEDDVDWDLSIRQQLAPSARIPDVIRTLTISEPVRLDLNPYGSEMELLWLGHCGIRTKSSKPNITIIDETILPLYQLHVWDHRPVQNIKEHQRQVRLGGGPVCSWAYAVTWQAAQILLEFLESGEAAFDVDLENACQHVLDCVTLNPELFNTASIAGQPGLIDKANGRKNMEVGFSGTDETSKTPNIPYSTRCNAGRGDEDRIQCLP